LKIWVLPCFNGWVVFAAEFDQAPNHPAFFSADSALSCHMKICYHKNIFFAI